MCYNGNTSCAIDELADLREKTIAANYDICNPSDLIDGLMNLEYILDQLKYDNENNLLGSKYKILVFMNTDLAKDEIKNDWEYIYNSFSGESSETVTFLRIWTALNENWGMKPNGKAKFKMRKVKNSRKEYTITLKSLPYIN